MESTSTVAYRNYRELFGTLPAGAKLVRNAANGVTQYGYWTNQTSVQHGMGFGVVYVAGSGFPGGIIVYVSLDDDPNGDVRTWKVCDQDEWLGSGDLLTAIVTAAKFAAENRRHESFKGQTREKLVDWFDENLDSAHTDSFNDLLDDLGFDKMTRSFTVTGTVTYNYEVEVEATDEDAAREAVDEYFGDTVASNIDTYDYTDYEIDSVDEA